MIEYNFKIIRDEGVEKVTILPKLPTKMNSLASIEGPNSTGKSTLLNMIALGCGGLRDSKLHPTLIDKLKDLAEAKHQEVTFEIQVDGDDGQKLFFEKPKGTSPEVRIMLSKNGKKTPLSPEEFRKQYALIYDIPENPIGRVKELTRELLDENNKLANRLKQLELHLREVLEDISKARNPKRIKEVEDEVKRFECEKIALEQSYTELNENHENFKKYGVAKNYVEFGNELRSAQKSLKLIKIDEREQEKDAEDADRGARELQNQIKEKYELISKLISSVTPKLRKMFPKGAHFLESWEAETDWREGLAQGGENDGLAPGIAWFEERLLKYKKDNTDPAKVNEAEVIEALINVLNEFEDYEVVVPGVNKGVRQFTEVLKERMKECSQYAKLASDCDSLLKNLGEMHAVREDFVSNISPKIKEILKKGKVKSAPRSNKWEQEEKATQLRERIKEIERKQKHYLQECLDLKMNENFIFDVAMGYERLKEYKQFSTYSEVELNNVVADKWNSIARNSSETASIKERIRQREDELRRLKERKPHKYQDFLAELNQVYDSTLKLRQLVDVKCRGYINEILENEKPSTGDPDRVSFFEQLWRYLGRRVRMIRHGEHDYQVEEIDLTKKEIHVQGGRVIRLGDMGTGQQQAAYLKGLLTNHDSRKIIALFDEVAMMDTQSIKPIRETMRKLHEEGRLLLGVIVQRADVIKVSPL